MALPDNHLIGQYCVLNQNLIQVNAYGSWLYTKNRLQGVRKQQKLHNLNRDTALQWWITSFIKEIMLKFCFASVRNLKYRCMLNICIFILTVDLNL